MVQELRIGNWIYDSECAPHYFQVEEIRKYVGYELWVYFRNGSIKTKEPEFIPLTEDILVKAGFTGSINDGYGLDLVELDYITSDEHFQLELKIAGNAERWFIIDVKFVHELQNLFKALTGKELTIEL